MLSPSCRQISLRYFWQQIRGLPGKETPLSFWPHCAAAHSWELQDCHFFAFFPHFQAQKDLERESSSAARAKQRVAGLEALVLQLQQVSAKACATSFLTALGRHFFG